ncbi:MAG: phosphate acyltransferase, partial [Pseudomonadota bacterium]
VPGIDRPAIASFFPTMRGRSVLLDLGANTDCQPENLVQFAVMGALYAKAVLGLGEPTIGLLNVGAEALKGNDVVKDAAALLRESPLPGQFRGFVEGDDIPAGTVDVVVTDGFTGNVALKTAEGTARLYTGWLKDTFRRGPLARLGYLMARGAFKHFRQRMDPRRYNGGMFVGLRGICVKSHGGMDGEGFANAIDVSIDLVRNRFNDQLVAELQAFGDDDASSTLIDIGKGSASIRASSS